MVKYPSGAEPLEDPPPSPPQLQRVASPPQGKTWRLEDVIAKLNEKYGTQLLVNFFVGTDDKDSNSFIIHVGVGLRAESLVLSSSCFFLTRSLTSTRSPESIELDAESPANDSGTSFLRQFDQQTSLGLLSRDNYACTGIYTEVGGTAPDGKRPNSGSGKAGCGFASGGLWERASSGSLLRESLSA